LYFAYAASRAAWISAGACANALEEQKATANEQTRTEDRTRITNLL
jgi:hypothetical protein